MDITCKFSEIKTTIGIELENAKSEILIAVAWFTRLELFQILRTKAKAGVQIKMVIIDDYINNRIDGLQFQELIDLGVQFYFGGPSKPMHNKFCIIDGEVLITGSYNWTYYAEYKNFENILIIKDNLSVLENYTEEFQKLLNGLQIVKTIVPNQAPDVGIMNLNEYLGHEYLFHSKQLAQNGNTIAAIANVKKAERLLPDNESVRTAKEEYSNNVDTDFHIKKIRFTDTETIIYFNTKQHKCRFHGPLHENAWFIRDAKNPGTVYKLNSLVLTKDNDPPKNLNNNEVAKFWSLPLYEFNCELHFPLLAKEIESIDLIEGSDYDNAEFEYWNFYDYKLPTRD